MKQKHENFLPEIKRVPANPPTFNQKVFQKRRYRYVLQAGGTIGSYAVETQKFVTDFELPATSTPFQVESISAWTFATPTVATTFIGLVDVETGKSFEDSGQIGQPSAKAGYKYSLSTRQKFFTAGSNVVFTTVNFTVGAQVVIDIIVSALV